MPITRKQQILAKVETSEGVSANPTSADAVQVYNPSYSDSVDTQNRVPAGASLSRDFTPIGRSSRQLSFETDFRGNGDTSIPVSDPDFATFLQGSGYKRSTIKALTLGAVTGTGFQVGEIVQTASGANRGVIIGAFTSGGALVHLATAVGTVLVVAVLVGTFAAAATTGEASGSTSTTSAVADYAGACYQPTSEKLVQVEASGGWTGTSPAAAGEVLDVETTGGAKIGAVQVQQDLGAMELMNVTPLWGTMVLGNVLRSAGNGTATISLAPVQIRTPSVTARHNLDGRRRDALGTRFDFTLEGDVGAPMIFKWTASGDLGPAIDALPIQTTGLSTIRPPRMIGAIFAYGKGNAIYRLPTKRAALQNNGSANPNLDANRAGGSTGSNITDRDPSVTFTVDQVHSAFDWEALRDAGSTVRIAWVIGTVKGNIVGIVAPVGQVTEVSPSDSDGIATFDVTVALRRVLESGDDEAFIFQL